MDYAAWVGTGCFLGLLVIIMLGIPIFVAMLVVSIIGFWLLGGFTFVTTQLTYAPFGLAENYMFAVIPLFIVMGELASQTGLAADTFNALRLWIGKLRGGLLMATIGSNAVFGAVSSMPLAVTMLSVKVALPELLKHKYDKKFCLAAIASAGVLDELIPPSTGTLIFCLLTNVSVGRALVAGILPGIALTFIYFMTVWVYGKMYPNKIPVVPMEVSWGQRWRSTTTLWPVLGLFTVIIGGVYLGIFPATVGGAIGAMAALIYALGKRVKTKVIANSFWDMVVLNCQMFPMLICAMLFSRMTALTGMTKYLVDFIVGLNAPPLAVMAVFVVLMVLISFPMDLMPVMVITLPVFFPLLTGIGFSPYVLNVIWLLLGVLASQTPPIGMSVYVVSALAKVNIMDIYRGVIPWFIITFVFLWIIILWPPLTDFLPNLLYK